jgi:hypothetical protein
MLKMVHGTGISCSIMVGMSQASRMMLYVKFIILRPSGVNAAMLRKFRKLERWNLTEQ